MLGPPDFDVEVGGVPVLTEREQSHMRDVRGVFAAFAALAGAAVVVLAALYVGARRGGHLERWWSAVRAGAIGLVGAILVGGVITIFAFDTAFEVFHQLFFPSGSYPRPGDRPPRPALPVCVLVRDDDGPRRQSSSRWRRS